MRIKYKGNQMLFNEFQNLKWRVQGLSAITQNSETGISNEDYLEWLERAAGVEKDLSTLIVRCMALVGTGEVIKDA